MRKLKAFFSKKNIAGILVTGLAGYLVLSMTSLGAMVTGLINKYRG